LSNFGNAAVGIQSVAVQSAPGIDDFSQSSDCGTSLPAQSICTITVGSSRRTMGGSQSLITVSGDFGSLANPIVATADKVYDFGYTLLTSSKTGDTMQAESNNGVQITESVTGTNASDFLAGNCHTSGFEICSASVVFTPSAVGLRTADLTGTSSVNTAPIASYLQGTGVSSPVVSAVLGSTAEEYIPSSSAGSSSFYLINNGTTTLDVAELAIGSPFTLGSYSCGGSAVPPLQSCTVNVTVGGTQWGYVSPNVTVFDSASGQNISLPLYAVVSVGPQVAVSSVSFPNTQINDVSSPVSFTVTPQYGHGVTAYTSAPIQPVKGSCAAGESPCVLSFVFAPTSVGSDSYKIGVEDNFFGGITYVSVTATGTPVVIPGLAGVSPASLSFPTRAVGSTSIPMTVTLSNTGAGSFAITSTGLSGTNASEFSYTSTCGSSVASNGSCTLGVTFAPTSAGSKSASLTIYGDVSAGLPLVIAITGAAQ
jgi:hypothetical protein